MQQTTTDERAASASARATMRRRGVIAGVLATLVMLVVVAVLRYTTGFQSLPEIIAEGIVGLMPASVFSAVLDRLQKAAQPVLYVGILIGMLAVGGLLGRGFSFGPPTWGRALKLALALWVAFGVVIMPLLGMGLFGSALRGGLFVQVVEQAIVFGGFAAALVLILRALEPMPANGMAVPATADRTAIRRQRRIAVAGIAGGLVAIGIGGALFRALLDASLAGSRSAASSVAGGLTGTESSASTSAPAGSAAADSSATAASAPPEPAAASQAAPSGAAAPVGEASAPVAPGAAPAGARGVPSLTAPPVPMTVAPGAASPAPFNVPGLTTEVLSAKDFYTVSKNLIDPDVNVSSWSLKIDGLVQNPATYGFDDIKDLPFYSDYYTLQCISNEVGGDLWGNAHWKGVRLVELLSRAVLKAGIRKVVFHAEDGYTDSIPLDAALRPDAILAYEMNGEPLTKAHGYPARLLIPGIYGMKNVKWINRIELVDYDFKGYWMERGWSDVATYQTSTRIDTPQSRAQIKAGQVSLAGVTFAGGVRGIERVEVSLDNGASWEPAVLKPALSQNAWNLWVFRKDLGPGTSMRVAVLYGAISLQPRCAQ